MDLNDLICKLQLSDYRVALSEGWEGAQASRPEELSFLKPEFLAEVGDWCSLPEEAVGAVTSAAQRIAAVPELAALAWYFHHQMYLNPAFRRAQIGSWPPNTYFESVLGEEAGMLYLLALVSGLPHVLSFHRDHELPEELSRAILADVNRFASQSREETGHWGLWGPDRLNWLIRHFQGDIYRLGRLQFEFGPFIGRLVVFRHTRTRKVLALAEDGVRYLADGRLWTEARDGPGSWTARLCVEPEKITGHVVTVLGHAQPEAVTLPAEEWVQVLAKGDPVLNIHIPPGSPMAHDACGDSFRWAEEFFPSHFPDRSFRAYCCDSWLLDTQLAEFLPPEANMARFQREMYLFQTIGSDENLMRPIYGQVRQFQPAPKNTSLQRALNEFLESGGVLRGDGGGSFILRDDLDWGREVYRRRMADPRALEE
jgi:hypothetical protein